MSNIYIQEPPTQGKVLLKTTVGDIDIELWSKETPKACRNFVQLCLEGYYNGTIFHRIVKGFIAQGGDPTGTGSGGDSIYGAPFKDEIHSRLRFNRRGLVAMANAGKDDNGSQFFFTLASTPELQNKHTIFGKVAGETIYNLPKLDDTLVDHDDRPIYPPKIIKTEVISNPFPDIVPRVTPKQKSSDKEEKKSKSDKTKAVKNYKLLSFGEEAEEDEEEASEISKKLSARGKSSHDISEDPTLSKELAVEIDHGSDSDPKGKTSPKRDPEKIDRIKAKLAPSKSKESNAKAEAHHSSSDEEYEFGKELREEKKRKMAEIAKEIRDLKKDYQKSKKSNSAPDRQSEKPVTTQKVDETTAAYREEQKKYKKLKEKVPLKGAAREEYTLSLLKKFRKDLSTVKVSTNEDGESEPEKTDLETDTDGKSWMGHKLVFESNDPVIAKDANTKSDDWFEIYDPRNPINKRRRDMSKEQLKTKEKRTRD
nr:PREDICTED: peptidyl-prolyl cis-trans isomerase CWC27 homolog [Bemisia tabaci]